MSRKPSNFREIINVFEELHKNYPYFSIGRHISTAFSDYGDLWGISEKEFLFALNKYKTELELGFVPDSEDSLNKIIDDATNNLFEIDDEENQF